MILGLYTARLQLIKNDIISFKGKDVDLLDKKKSGLNPLLKLNIEY